VIIAFDDEKTSVEVIEKKLKEGTFPVKGNPVYLKAFPDGNQSR
jgi:hypothetical protein